MNAEIASFAGQLVKELVTIVFEAAKGDPPPPTCEIRARVAQALLDHAKDWIDEARKEANGVFNG